MPATESELLDALRRDAGALHVYIDWLLERGDPRGEILALQQHDAASGIHDAATLERLLVLVAQHGFVRVPDDPEAASLPFRGGSRRREGRLQVEYRLVHEHREYTVIDPLASEIPLRITVDGEIVVELPRQPPKQRQQMLWQMFLPEIANVVLTEISAAIRAGDPWDRLEIPTGPQATSHPYHRVGRFPTEAVGDDFVESFPAARGCEIELRDLARWRELHQRLALLR